MKKEKRWLLLSIFILALSCDLPDTAATAESEPESVSESSLEEAPKPESVSGSSLDVEPDGISSAAERTVNYRLMVGIVVLAAAAGAVCFLVSRGTKR